MISIDRLKEMALEDIENNPEKHLEQYTELLQELDQLKAENEELKEENAKYRIEAFKQGQLALRDLDRNYKLKQALTEIKEIAEIKQKQSVFVGETVFGQILQKCNEVLDECSK